MLTCLAPVLFTFYIQSVLKLKKNNNSGTKGLSKSKKNERINTKILSVSVVTGLKLNGTCWFADRVRTTFDVGGNNFTTGY